MMLILGGLEGTKMENIKIEFKDGNGDIILNVLRRDQKSIVAISVYGQEYICDVETGDVRRMEEIDSCASVLFGW